MEQQEAGRRARNWVEQVVVALNLCPFARRVIDDDRLEIRVSSALDADAVLTDLHAALKRMDADAAIETLLLVLPQALHDFLDYNDFLDVADALLREGGWEGVYQIASFHPDYRFAGTQPADAENFTNRSPDPMLHILRERSVAAAIAGHPDIDAVPETNTALLRDLGTAEMRRRLQACAASAAGASSNRDG